MSEHSSILELPELLIDTHKDAYLDWLRRQGHDIAEWDPAKISSIPADSIDDTGISTVHFAPRLIELPLASTVCGARVISTGRFYTSRDWIGRNYRFNPHLAGNILLSQAEIVNGPDKVLDISLLHTARSSETNIARVFTRPGMKPMAIHLDDLTVAKESSGSTASDFDLEVRVGEFVDNEAVEFLDENVCSALMAAVRLGKPRIGQL